MGMLTHGRIDIAAPAADVFAWLVEPAKITAWLGASGGMPEDPSQLRAGWSSTTDSPPLGKVTVEVLAYEPPTHLEFRQTYPGGDSISTYRLAEGDGVTTLTLEGDTDWARPEGAWENAIDAALAAQPEDVRDVAEAQLDKVEDQLEAGAFDSAAQGQMQAAVDTSMQKLKALIEAR
jgi:uncharacterized protein YndB with AHSA1/START domain